MENNDQQPSQGMYYTQLCQTPAGIKRLGEINSDLLTYNLLLINTANEWEIEVAKNVALINSSGIAGCIALYASDINLPSHGALYPIILFSLGLMIILLVIFSASRLLFYKTEKIIQHYHKFLEGTLTENEIFSHGKSTWLKINYSFGALAFIFFMIGIIWLVCILCTS